jgi:hypothetical protein
MWKAFTAITLAVGLAGAAFAQSSGGSGSSGSTSGGMTGSTAQSDRMPGTKGQSDIAPGSGGRSTVTPQRPRIPPGESAADQARRGGGRSDLNRNSATGLPGMDRGAVGSGSMERSTLVPLGPGTGARDRGVPDSSVYNPGVPDR